MAIQIYRIIRTLTTSDLKHLVRIQRRDDHYDAGAGHGPGNWVDFDQRWAYVGSWGQAEQYKAHQRMNTITQLMVVRFDPLKEILEDMRVFLEEGHPQGSGGMQPTRWWRVQTVENYEERNMWVIVSGAEEKATEVQF